MMWLGLESGCRCPEKYWRSCTTLPGAPPLGLSKRPPEFETSRFVRFRSSPRLQSPTSCGWMNSLSARFACTWTSPEYQPRAARSTLRRRRTVRRCSASGLDCNRARGGVQFEPSYQLDPGSPSGSSAETAIGIEIKLAGHPRRPPDSPVGNVIPSVGAGVTARRYRRAVGPPMGPTDGPGEAARAARPGGEAPRIREIRAAEPPGAGRLSSRKRLGFPLSGPARPTARHRRTQPQAQGRRPGDYGPPQASERLALDDPPRAGNGNGRNRLAVDIELQQRWEGDRPELVTEFAFQGAWFRCRSNPEAGPISLDQRLPLIGRIQRVVPRSPAGGGAVPCDRDAGLSPAPGE